MRVLKSKSRKRVRYSVVVCLLTGSLVALLGTSCAHDPRRALTHERVSEREAFGKQDTAPAVRFFDEEAKPGVEERDTVTEGRRGARRQVSPTKE